MANFAIIQTGGKQYNVKLGEKIEVELLDKNEGDEVTFETLLISKEDALTIGKPLLKTSVKGLVKGEVKGEKLHIRKFKAKSRYRRHTGHRQKYTLVEITAI